VTSTFKLLMLCTVSPFLCGRRSRLDRSRISPRL
jgi:hypothetical protein